MNDRQVIQGCSGYVDRFIFVKWNGRRGQRKLFDIGFIKSFTKGKITFFCHVRLVDSQRIHAVILLKAIPIGIKSGEVLFSAICPYPAYTNIFASGSCFKILAIFNAWMESRSVGECRSAYGSS